MTDPATKYVYDGVPLPPGTFIRVLLVRPRELPSDPVSCDFHLLNLEDGSLCDFNTELQRSERVKVQYTALSYTWGRAKPLHTIRVNDRPVQVRHNLHAFLWRAVHNGLTDYLWIDALCIDQYNLQERNHQVSLMGKIYSSAERVIVWLGAVSHRVESALQELGTEPTPSWLPENREYYEEGILEFYHMAYWSRAWIVQEYVLAKAITIWCNSLEVDGSRLEHESHVLSHWRQNNPYEPDLPAMTVIVARARRAQSRKSQHLSAMGEGEETPREIRTLGDSTVLELLTLLGYDLQCADPRDRIYSLLSLLSPAEKAHLAMIPDYSKSTSDIFATVVGSFRIPDNGDRAAELESAVYTLATMLNIDRRDLVVKKAEKAIEASRR